MKKSLLLGTFLLLSIYLIAQPSVPKLPGNELPKDGVIKGKVFDAGISKPMEFSSIAVYRAVDSSLVTGTISANDGSFNIKSLPAGKYYLVANFMGYERLFVNEIIISENKSVVDLGVLNLKASTKNIDELEVVATQNRVEYKIDRKVINVSQDLNAAGGSAVDVLQNTPSVTVDIDGNVSLRGSTNFTVLIDGRPSPLSGSDALQQIPATSIENIEIITNPSAKYDPDGMAGILNIITKKNSLQGLSGIFNTSIGSREKYSGDFLLSYKTQKFNVFGGIDYQNNKNFGSMSSLREMNPNSDTSTMVNLNGNRNNTRNGLVFKTGLDIYLKGKSTLSLSGDFGNHGHNSEMLAEMQSYTNPSTTEVYNIAEGIANRGGDYYNLNANYTKKFENPRHELQTSISYQNEKSNDIDMENEYPTDEFFAIIDSLPIAKVRSGENGHEIEFRLNVDYTRPLFVNGFLETGYQMRIDNESEEYVFENYDPDTDSWTKDAIYSSGNYFTRNIQAGYATYSDKIGKFEYKLGLRAEYTNRSISKDKNSDAYTLERLDFFPTAHISRQFAGNQQVLTSYSRRINRPGGGDLEPFRTYMNSYTLREGNPELQPEYVNSLELSYQKNFGKSFFVIESYYRNTQNLITRMMYQDPLLPGIAIMTSKNINSDNSIGGEFMLNLAVKKWFNLNTTVNLYKYWLEGTIGGEEINKESNNWDMRLNSSFFLSTKSRLQAMVMYNGPSVTAQGNRGSFFFANLAYRQDFLDRKLSATLSVQDIFGTMKHEFSSYSSTLNNTMAFEREHQVVTLTLSYKLNNFKSQERKTEDTRMNMDDSSGGF